MKIEEKYQTLTPTEVLKLVNDIKIKHEECKGKIIYNLNEVEKLDVIINDLTKNLDEIETKYVQLMELLVEKQK